MLDTCVYIDILQRRVPKRAKRLMTVRLSPIIPVLSLQS